MSCYILSDTRASKYNDILDRMSVKSTEAEKAARD